MMDIKELIPQREPIVMVDRFLGFDGDVSETEFSVSESNIFVANGRLGESGITEHIAQSAAARLGYLFRSQGKDIPLGYIGSVNKLKIERLPLVGARLHTEIKILQEVMGISLIEAQTSDEQGVVAVGQMKIFVDNGA